MASSVETLNLFKMQEQAATQEANIKFEMAPTKTISSSRRSKGLTFGTNREFLIEAEQVPGRGFWTKPSVRRREQLGRRQELQEERRQKHPSSRRRRSIPEPTTVRERIVNLDEEFDKICQDFKPKDHNEPSMNEEQTQKEANEGSVERQQQHIIPSVSSSAPKRRPCFIKSLWAHCTCRNVLLTLIALALLSKREMWGVYAENLIRGVYFTVHVCLTTVETALRLVAGQLYAADRLLETFKCDVAEAVCRRYRSLCDERCSHLDRYQRHSHVHPQRPY